MERVKVLTRRHFDRDSTDCQIEALTQRKPKPIRNPSSDSRVNSDSLSDGDLKPFTIYPILNNHGLAIWTLHVERRDFSPLSEADDRRVLALCSRVMKAAEEARRTAFEHTWYREMLGTSFYSIEDLLRRFADCVVANDIAVRCRIFLVNPDGIQTPLYQSGNLQAVDFSAVAIDERDLDIRYETSPVLCVRKGYETRLGHVDDKEFKLERECDDPHLKELCNEYRSQWVESPVRLEGRTIAKLVLDHSIDPCGDVHRHIGKDDAFTLGEMRLIGRLTRILGIAAEVARAYRVIAGLCCAGIHGKLIWHFVKSSTSVLFKMNGLPEEPKEELRRIGRCLDAFRGVLSTPTESKHTDLPSIGSEVMAGLDAIRPISSQVELPAFNPADVPEVAANDHSLFLVLVTLLENCVKYTKKVEEARFVGAIEIGVTRSEGKIAIAVSDNGIGIERNKAEELRNLFADPAIYFPWEHERGLAYVAFLVKEMGWQLSLVREKNPTTFEIVVSTHDAGEQT